MNAIPAGPYLPTSALVVVAWLGQRVPGLDASMVATSLPRDLATWKDAGFVQVTIIPGVPDIEIPVRHAYAQLDAWGANVSADGAAQSRPAINKATRLAELVMRATENDLQSFGRPVAMPTNYLPVRVQAAYPASEPSPIPDDPSGYGRVSFDLALDWARI